MGVLFAAARTADLRNALAAGFLTADGGMGTTLASLLRQGAPRQIRCFDELNLSSPALVRDVHQQFLRAGAQIVGTNTFGANRQRLGSFGFARKTRNINQAGVRIAREAARAIASEKGMPEASAFVAGAVGPLGVPLAPLGPVSGEEARAMFREQMEALVESGVDLLALETFQDLRELREAILAAREAGGEELVVAAYLSVEADGTLACGASVEEFTRQLDQWPIDVIGLNCSFGPRAILETVEKMAAWTGKPLSVMPNAGLPAGPEFDYPCSPEYFSSLIPDFVRAGVRIVGGCCGTTPEHVRSLRAALEAAREDARQAARDAAQEDARDSDREDGRDSDREDARDSDREAAPDAVSAAVHHAVSAESFARIEIVDRAELGSGSVVAAAERSELASGLAAGRFVTMVELPPPSGADASQQIAAALQYQRDGIGCLAIAETSGAGVRLEAAVTGHLIQQGAGIECVIPVQSRDPRAVQGALLAAHALGIRNVLCAAAASAVAANLNRGQDRNGRSAGSRTAFCIGIPLHPASGAPPEESLSHADFVIAEPVYELDTLEQFLKQMEPYGLPVIASLRPLASLRDAVFLMQERNTAVPQAYLQRMKTTRSGEAEGVEIAREMLAGLSGMAAGVYLRSGYDGAAPAPELVRAIGRPAMSR